MNKGYGDQVGNSFMPALLLKATRCHPNLRLWRNTAVISLKLSLKTHGRSRSESEFFLLKMTLFHSSVLLIIK